MPIHDWTRVDAGIFHDFHHEWVSTIKNALNQMLPPNYYALVEKSFEIAESGQYETLAKSIVVHWQIDHRIVALVVIVSPGNKSDRARLGRFVARVDEMLSMGKNLLIVDLFPPGAYDPKGIHHAIWGEYEFDVNRPLTCVSYVSGPVREAYLEPVAVGQELTDMPVFLAAERYVSLPLELTYQAAWSKVPPYWRNVVEGKQTK